MKIRRANERGVTEIDWLKSYHTFSFGDYYDPKNMGFKTLRVINDDYVAPGKGFGFHGHRDMEIITIVLDGAIEHKDSLGSGEVLRPGEVQVMSAGTGIRHSEFNPLKDKELHLLQIWIEPAEDGLTPSYAQKEFPRVERENRLQRVAGGGREVDDGALTINQSADLYLTELAKGNKVTHPIAKNRSAWVHLATGEIEINGEKLSAGDAAAFEASEEINFQGIASNSQVLLFELN